MAIVAEELPSRLEWLERGTYFPAPLARAVAAGRAFDDALMSFHYPPITVDADRRWVWKGRPVADRIRRFFIQHICYEPSLGVYFVEYRVNDGWWDKCYSTAPPRRSSPFRYGLMLRLVPAKSLPT